MTIIRLFRLFTVPSRDEKFRIQTHSNENKGHFGSIGKDLYESQAKTGLHVSEWTKRDL
jgi:hypothetical protein